MNITVVFGIFCLIMNVYITEGCHTPLHLPGADRRPDGEETSFPDEDGSVSTSPEDRIRLLLADHNLETNIINCVVDLQTNTKRRRRDLFEPLIRDPNSEESLQIECSGEYRGLCLDVLACANRLGVDIPELNFLSPTTTTTTLFQIPELPEFPDFKFPLPDLCFSFFGCDTKDPSIPEFTFKNRSI